MGGIAATLVLVVGESAAVAPLSGRLLAARAAAGLPPPQPQMGWLALEAVLSGLLLVWVYAAIRPRFGPGRATAIRAGVAVWVSTPFLMTAHMIYDNFGFPAPLLVQLALGLLPAFVIASLVGAWLYRE